MGTDQHQVPSLKINIRIQLTPNILYQGTSNSHRHPHSGWLPKDQEWKWQWKCVSVSKKDPVTPVMG